MTDESKHRYPRSSGRFMRTDDMVTPHFNRRGVAVLGAIGVVLICVAISLLAVGIDRRVRAAQDTAALNAGEVQQIRQLIAERGAFRDREATLVQTQVDAQTRALCLALSKIIPISGPNSAPALVQAQNDLMCAALPAAPAPRPADPLPNGSGPTITLPGSVNGNGSLSGPATPAQGGGVAPVTPPAPPVSTPAPPVPPAPPAPVPAPTVPRAPLPTIVTPRGTPTLLDPVTDPMCNILGICV